MNWNGTITAAGAALLAQWTGGSTLYITKATAGSGWVEAASMAAQTALSEEKQTASIVAQEVVDAGRRLTLRITPMAQSYDLTQFGVWGKLNGGTETLLALYQTTTVDGVKVPGLASGADFVYTFFALIQFAGSGTLTVEVDPSATMTAAEAVRYDASQPLTQTEKSTARDNIGAAPDGFGVGTSPKLLTSSDDLDDIIGQCGWYNWGSSIPANGPTLMDANQSYSYCSMMLIGSFQFVFSLNTKGVVARRDYSVGRWSPWEYENPIMLLNTEYRTTERYLNKPVYTKVINTGAIAANTIDDVTIGVSNIDKVWIEKGFATTATGLILSIPYYSSSDGDKVLVSVHPGAIHRIYDGSTWTISQVTVTLKYTKTTD